MHRFQLHAITYILSSSICHPPVVVAAASRHCEKWMKFHSRWTSVSWFISVDTHISRLSIYGTLLLSLVANAWLLLFSFGVWSEHVRRRTECSLWDFILSHKYSCGWAIKQKFPLPIICGYNFQWVLWTSIKVKAREEARTFWVFTQKDETRFTAKSGF